MRKMLGWLAAAVLMGLVLGCTPVVSGDTTRPTVVSATPASGTANSALNTALTAKFSKSMNPATITTTTFKLAQGSSEVSGVVTYLAGTAAFVPIGQLSPTTTYVATIDTAVADVNGNALAAPYSWSFTTGTVADTANPTVVSVTPANYAGGVATSAALSVVFNKAMNATSLTTSTFTLKAGSTPVDGAVSYSGTTAVFTPTASLAVSTQYTASITTGATDIAGNPLVAAYSWVFTTSPLAGADLPRVSTVIPELNATGVGVNSAISATFSRGMAPLTVDTTSFTLSPAVAGTSVTYSNTTATLSHTADFAANTLYTATLSATCTDAAGTSMAADFAWTFTTGAGRDLTPPTVASIVPAASASSVAVNSAISATFSEGLNPSTIGATSFTLSPTVAGSSVSYSGNTAVLAHSTALAYNTTYTATISTAVTDLAGNAMTVNKVWTFTTGLVPDLTPPTVAPLLPSNGTTAVSVGIAPTATFSKAMDPLTITSATITMTHGGILTSGVVTYSGTTATFTPTAALLAGTLYTVAISTGVKDLAGNAMVSPYSWSFQTAAAPIAPTVLTTSPIDGGGAAIGALVSATFSANMNATTIGATSFTLSHGGISTAGVVSYSGTTATFTPSAALLGGTLYTATITTAVKDVAGTAMAANKVWTFTTTSPPTVVSTSPLNGATGVAVAAPVTATFSVAMNPATINATSFSISPAVAGVTVSYSGNTATLSHTADLLYSQVYTATITTAATNSLGLAMTSAYTWSFTTVLTHAALGPATVPLLTSAHYAIFGNSAISNAGTSAVTGDVGIDPAAASFITGFSLGGAPGTTGYATSAQLYENPAYTGSLGPNGSVYAPDYGLTTPAVVHQSNLDMAAAYGNAFGRTAVSYAFSELGGANLGPRLYTLPAGTVLMSTDMTLTGGPNDIWIFQIPGTLTVANGITMHLVSDGSGAPKSKNIFWQVAGGTITGVTIGTTATVEGTFMALKAITVNTGATVHGRLFSQSAVTLASNVVTIPSP